MRASSDTFERRIDIERQVLGEQLVLIECAGTIAPTIRTVPGGFRRFRLGGCVQIGAQVDELALDLEYRCCGASPTRPMK